MPSRSTAWISEAGTPLRLENSSRLRSSASSPFLAAGGGHRRGQVGVGRVQLPGHDPADGGQRQPLLLKVADLVDALHVLGAVPGHAPLALGLWQQSAGLVIADRVHGHVARRSQLLDPVPHDQPLYECALEGSMRRRPPTRETPGAVRCGPMKLAARPVSLAVVIACVSATMVFGIAAKADCASGNWGDQRQYKHLCYSDIVPLLGTEQLEGSGGSRLPFINPCKTVPGQNCDEYPVLTMYFMRVAAWFSGNDYARFYYVNAALLLVCALLISFFLYLMAGRRALYFALAPTLLVYGTMNWDLLAVVFATGGLLYLFSREDVKAGAMLGLGAAAKFYPGMLALPFIGQRLRDRRPDAAIKLGWATLGAWALINLPFFLASPSSWFRFFSFNKARAPDFDSLWYIRCRHSPPGASRPAR